MTDEWIIDETSCKKCGACVDVCPNRMIQKDANSEVVFLQSRLWSCFRCGHCMAVCPNEAIQIPGLSYEKDFFTLPVDGHQDSEGFYHLLETRRAIRNYLEKPVPHEALEKIVDAIRLAPPGFPPVKTEITVVEDPEKIKQALPMMIRLYDILVKKMSNPVTRIFVRLNAGPEKYKNLKNHMIPLLIDRLPDLKSGKEDTILRGAPAMILFHADREAENYATDIHIALTYGFLAAHSLGLGASAMDLIPPAVEKSRELREFFKIPDNHIVTGAIILGYAKHHFKRGIKRDLKSVTWI